MLANQRHFLLAFEHLQFFIDGPWGVVYSLAFNYLVQAEVYVHNAQFARRALVNLLI